MRLRVEPASAPVDGPLAFWVDGLEARAVVELSALAVDAFGARWESRAAFRAEGDGRVDPGRQAPESGSYQGVLGQGLLCSMRHPGSDSSTGFVPRLPAFEVVLSAETAGSEPVRVVVERRLAADGVTRVAVRGDRLTGSCFLPAGRGPGPGVALYHGATGGIGVLEPAAALLASHGYAVLVVGTFGVGGLPDSPCEVPLEALASGVRWLQARPEVDSRRVGALGVGLGAEAMLATAAWAGELALGAVVAVSPSSVVWQAPGQGPARPRWSVARQALPFVPLSAGRQLAGTVWARLSSAWRGSVAPVPTLAAYRAGLEDAEACALAAIPVERIAAPFLLLAGEDDRVWPAAAMSAAIQARRAGTAHGARDEVVTCPRAGHLTLHVPGVPACGCPDREGRLPLGGTVAGDAEATVSAWGRILGFLGCHLRGPR